MSQSGENFPNLVTLAVESQHHTFMHYNLRDLFDSHGHCDQILQKLATLAKF